MAIAQACAATINGGVSVAVTFCSHIFAMFVFDQTFCLHKKGSRIQSGIVPAAAMTNPLATALFGSSIKQIAVTGQKRGTIVGSVRSVRSIDVSAAQATYIARTSTLSFGNW